MPEDPRNVATIRDVAHLDDLLSTPDEDVIEALGRVEGDILVLGVSGKMGPTLARMALRGSELAGVRRRVFGVARFSDEAAESSLLEHGIETIRCDLLDPVALDRLPDAPNVIFMAGMKFGSTGREGMTWAINTHLPGLVARRFAKSRIVAFSTGNIYGLTPVARGGSKESDTPSPQGEYAMSCLGRERIFEYFSVSMGIPTALIRLNYATEMRYGVLVDLARKVQAGEPVDLAMGYLNAIWQGDASAQTLRALEHVESPACFLNVSGPETLSVREVAGRFGELFDKPVTFRGQEAPEALLSDTSKARGLFGPPRVGVDRVIEWTADWLGRGGPTSGKPTRFEVIDGRF
ncbi:NAD-dependent epimerase/dehydratase family protein [Tundrisphaera lichenicola]|uniref:NAD-dependent epimerase/dehydratase family protein n=1 Tax=Tundrisphaera lichenicola TaxID=2029860 RepID=UPI003EC0C30B